MAAINRTRAAHRDYAYRSEMGIEYNGNPHEQMADYQPTGSQVNGNLTPSGDGSMDRTHSEPSFRVAVTLKKDNGNPSQEWELIDTQEQLPTGQFHATPVEVGYRDGEIPPDRHDSYPRRAEGRRSKERSDLYWGDGEESGKRSPQHHPHRRHNTSPDHRQFVSAIGVMNQGQTAKTAALTKENLKRFEDNERQKEFQSKQMKRSYSNNSLDKRHDVGVNVGKNFGGSTSSIDLHSIGGDSFFQMVQDFREETDQRSPAPPHLDKLLQGRTPPNDTEPDARTSTMSSTKSDLGKEDKKNTDKGPKLHGRLPSKRGKKSNHSGAEVSLLRRLRTGKGGEGGGKASAESKLDDEQMEARIEEGVKRRAFLHYDLQSVYFDLLEIIKIVQNPERKRSTLTGASAASSRQMPSTPSGSLEDLLGEEQDPGDGRSNDLVLSCPFFRNELGEESEPRVSLSKMGTLNTRVMRKFKHRVILERVGDGRGILHNPRGPVLELVDQGALYYRQYFEKHEHQNYFGIDDTLGPVALSVRREKLESPENPPSDNGKDSSARYLYRVILRTSELTTLRGYMMEDSIPSSAKHNTSRGLPLRDLLEYSLPDLPLSCLKLATNSEKTREHLCKLDEQGLSNKYKVGILHCKAGQSSEEEMYNNEHSGPAFEEFLECIGERVKLKGFVKYRAQLDNKTDSTGSHSIYAVYQGNEIMFHVSTLLPYTANNRQQLPRKRHVGNDIVTIIFQEPGSLPFTPKTVRSHFQHIFIIIRAHEPNTDNVHYSVAVSRSRDVQMFGPPLPEEAIFTKSQAFADFILAKAINAENAVHRTEKFVAMATRTRKEYLKDLAMNHVTNHGLDSGGKFSLFNKKKEKSCPRPAPDFKAKGALVWDIMVEDYSLVEPVSCYLAISPDMIVLLKRDSKETLFSIPCKAVIGWTPHPHSLKLYFNEGNCIRMRINDDDLDEIPEIVKRLEAVSTGTKTHEFTLRRNGLGQLGFHVHFQGIVVEVDPYGYTWSAGLRKGARLVEICEIAVCTQTHEEMIDLLRTSMTVKVSVVPPYADGSPRRGTTPLEYISADEDVSDSRLGFSRTRSAGRGANKMSGSHTFHGTPTSRDPAVTSSYPYPPTVHDESLPHPGNVRSTIQTFERKIHTEDTPPGRQRKYRNAVNYWDALGDKGRSPGVGSHLGSRAEGVDRSLMRLAQERRSVREGKRSPQRPGDLPLRMRCSQEELDRITSRDHSRESSFEDDYRNRGEVIGRGSVRGGMGGSPQRTSDLPLCMRCSQEALDRITSWNHSRESSFEAYTDNPVRPPSKRDQYNRSQSSQSSQNQFVSTTPQYKRANVAKATIKLTGSRDALHINNNSNERWYDSKEYDPYQDTTVPVSKDVLPDNYIQTSSGSQHSVSVPRAGSLKEWPSNYTQAERYSPTEHLYQPIEYELSTPSMDASQDQPTEPAKSRRSTHHAHSSSNLSEVSINTVSTHSSGSGVTPRDQRGEVRSHHGSIKRQSFPQNTPEARGKQSASPTTPVTGGREGREFTSLPRRTNTTASSSSGASDSSPRSSKRRGAEGRNSSNESLNSRLRPGVTGPSQDTKVQDDLRKLLAPEEEAGEKRADPYTAGRSRGRSSAGGLAQYRVTLPPELSARPPPHPNRGTVVLSRTCSDESLAAGGGPQPTKKAPTGPGGGGSNRNSTYSETYQGIQSSTLPLKQDMARNRGPINPRISPEGAASPALAGTFPLPDATTSLDWKNLVETAQMFEDHQAYRSVSADTLNDMDDSTPTVSALSQRGGHRGMSKSSGSISRDNDPQPEGRARSMSQREASRSSNNGATPGKSKEQLEQELQDLKSQLSQERQFKDTIHVQLEKLLQAQGNRDTAGSAQDLREFTQWYFSNYEK